MHILYNLYIFCIFKQFTKLEDARRRLDEFRELVLDTIYNACIATFLQAGYIVDNSNTEQTTYGKFGNFNYNISQEIRFRIKFETKMIKILISYN